MIKIDFTTDNRLIKLPNGSMVRNVTIECNADDYIDQIVKRTRSIRPANYEVAKIQHYQMGSRAYDNVIQDLVNLYYPRDTTTTTEADDAFHPESNDYDH